MTRIPRIGWELLLILRDSGSLEARGRIKQFLADPDPAIHFAAIQWVGEQRLAEYRPQLLEGLSSAKVSRQVFEGTLAALEMLDGKKRGPREEVAGEDFIAALLADAKTPAVVLRRGLRLLRPDHPALTPALMKRFLASPDESLRLEAVRTLLPALCPGGSRLSRRSPTILMNPPPCVPRRSWAWPTERVGKKTG